MKNTIIYKKQFTLYHLTTGIITVNNLTQYCRDHDLDPIRLQQVTSKNNTASYYKGYVSDLKLYTAITTGISIIPSLPNEQWKPCPGYSNYEASTLGRVRSTTRIVTRSDNINVLRRGQVLKACKDSLGYTHYRISADGSTKNKVVKAHRLIALTWIPNPINKPQVNHKDLDRANNNITNLEWVTASENLNHFYLNGTVDQKYNQIKTLRSPSNKLVSFINVNKFCRDNNLSVQAINQVLDPTAGIKCHQEWVLA